MVEAMNLRAEQTKYIFEYLIQGYFLKLEAESVFR